MNTPEEYIAAMQPKLCINCKHIARNGSGDASKFRCFAKQNEQLKTVDLVTGESLVVFKFATCYDAREAQEGFMLNGKFVEAENCGATGRWFEEAPPKFNSGPPPSMKTAASDLLSQLDAMK